MVKGLEVEKAPGEGGLLGKCAYRALLGRDKFWTPKRKPANNVFVISGFAFKEVPKGGLDPPLDLTTANIKFRKLF